ncbi:MAG: Pyridoxal-5'-phosphate-dependent protein beta subunit [Acetothermia bacterium 64_32]|nr:MAG: Pyridoxal-5'-phosphate-dependent protein beta subunit [Acetothermia bacterium 64_32]HAF71278.1 pyridoxal-5-phosphate-dependent protein subunit beta [Candidatus Acetothermia bacterium]
MIDLRVDERQLERTARRARERGIIVPTFKQMREPDRYVPEKIKRRLGEIGLWDLHPLNLFRITWKNEPVPKGGLYGGVNYLELPEALTGVPARIFALVGKWFPTGSHKVGATFGCLAPRLVTGQFDPTFHKAVWPSTGNYCRGGAYVANLLACESIAILPEEMSRERFEWLSKVAGEVIATPGCESNVWEIFQKCKELEATRDNVMIFNQFDEFGNHLWHYAVTGPAMEEVLRTELAEGQRLAGLFLTSGSSGTLGCADYIKERFPQAKLAVGEAWECPTLLLNGFGGHRIEGIGDKHVPWIHNVRNTDLVVDIDDEFPMRLIRLFNEPAGQEFLVSQGVPEPLVEKLPWLGISSAANLIGAIKLAKYYELTSRDAVLTVFTDSMELYGSRIQELREKYGPYEARQAAIDYERFLLGITTDRLQELTYWDRRRIHNLKYYTWVEQMGRSAEELLAQWYEWPDYWDRIHSQVGEIDVLIEEFNRRTGLLETL